MQRTTLFLLAFLPALLPAQNISSVISGIVQDPTGAVVAGAQIKATSEDRGFVRTSVTNTDGFFSFPDLTPATFTLSVSAPLARPTSFTCMCSCCRVSHCHANG